MVLDNSAHNAEAITPPGTLAMRDSATNKAAKLRYPASLWAFVRSTVERRKASKAAGKCPDLEASPMSQSLTLLRSNKQTRSQVPANHPDLLDLTSCEAQEARQSDVMSKLREGSVVSLAPIINPTGPTSAPSTEPLKPRSRKIAEWIVKAAQVKEPKQINQALVDGIKTNSVRAVNLSHRHLDNDHILCAALQPLLHNSSVLELDLSFNKLGPLAINALARVLSAPQSGIRMLRLAGTELGDKGLKTLAPALAVNGTLAHLDLSDCNISSRGLSALLRSFLSTPRTVSTLSELSLQGNKLSDASMGRLGDFVLRESIVKLDLGSSSSGKSNSIGSTGIRRLASAIAVRPGGDSLKQLRLTGNPLRSKAGNGARELLQIRCAACIIEFES